MTEISTVPEAADAEVDLVASPAAGAAPAEQQRRRSKRPPVLVIVAIAWLVVVVLCAIFASFLTSITDSVPSCRLVTKARLSSSAKAIS